MFQVESYGAKCALHIVPVPKAPAASCGGISLGETLPQVLAYDLEKQVEMGISPFCLAAGSIFCPHRGHVNLPLPSPSLLEVLCLGWTQRSLKPGLGMLRAGSRGQISPCALEGRHSSAPHRGNNRTKDDQCPLWDL